MLLVKPCAAINRIRYPVKPLLGKPAALMLLVKPCAAINRIRYPVKPLKSPF
jgi:hypothetical protein